MEIHGGMDDLPCVMGPDPWPGGYVVDLLIGSGARGSERKGQRGLGGSHSRSHGLADSVQIITWAGRIPLQPVMTLQPPHRNNTCPLL